MEHGDGGAASPSLAAVLLESFLHVILNEVKDLRAAVYETNHRERRMSDREQRLALPAQRQQVDPLRGDSSQARNDGA